MAQRRMISRPFVRSNTFLKLSDSAFRLYIMLLTDADDDGFNDGAMGAMRMANVGQDALDELLDAGLILSFDGSDVIVLTHWCVNNKMDKSKYTQTIHVAEFNGLWLTDDLVYVPIGIADRTTGCLAAEWRKPTVKPKKQVKAPTTGTPTSESPAEASHSEDSSSEDTTTVYGQFGNIELTDEQMDLLKRQYPSHYEDKIIAADLYKEDHPDYNVSSDYLMIIKFLNNDHIKPINDESIGDDVIDEDEIPFG